jgi:hypothetical protein
MRELSTNDLDAVVGGTVLSYPSVFMQEPPGTVHSMPRVITTTGQYLHVNEKMIRKF